MRENLIQTMFESLYHEGYHATNLNDLLKKADISKGGMYHHFNSKKELAMEAIKIAAEGFIDQFWSQFLRQHQNPIVALESILQKLPNAIIMGECTFEFRYGCPLNNLIQEMSAIDKDFNLLLHSILERWIDIVAESFKHAQENYTLKNDFDPHDMARFIVATIEGCLSSAKADGSEKSYTTCTTILIHLLKNLQLE
jgi:AcrR family transcriptional regulator